MLGLERRPKFTLAEVAAHSSAEDCWIIIHGKIYDVTKYLDDHPGGEQVLLLVAGEDASEEFEDAGHSRDARVLMDKYYVGELTRFKPEVKSQSLYKVVIPVVASALILGLVYYWRQGSESASESTSEDWDQQTQK